MRNICRKIGIGLLVVVVILGAVITASNFYFRHMSRQALIEATTTKAWVGIPNSNADVLIVAFMDYSDAVSYKIYHVMEEAVRTDGHVQVLIRPIAGTKDTFQMALYMDAASQLDPANTQTLHSQIVTMNPPPTLADIIALAKQLGIDNDKVIEMAKTKEVSGYAARDYQMFRRIGFRQPPAFIIGGKGYIPSRNHIAGVNAWLMMIHDARKRASEEKSEKP